MFVNPLTARDTLPRYCSDTKAVNSVTSVKRHVSVLVTLGLYIEGFHVMSIVVPYGYSAKFRHHTSTLGSLFWYMGGFFLTAECTQLKTKVCVAYQFLSTPKI